jgi:hypothetical protein
MLNHLFLICNSGVRNIENQVSSQGDEENKKKECEKNFGSPVEEEQYQHDNHDDHKGVFIKESYYICHPSSLKQ